MTRATIVGGALVTALVLLVLALVVRYPALEQAVEHTADLIRISARPVSVTSCLRASFCAGSYNLRRPRWRLQPAPSLASIRSAS
jgi:hypothetical protein